MYTWRCIIGNYVSISFLSFLLSACSTRQLFSNSPGISFNLNAAYWGSWASASLFVHSSIRKQMSNRDVMWTCFRCFPCCLRLGSLAAKDADAKSACTKSAEGIYSKSTYAEGAGAVEHSKIHSQSFWISEVKLFDIGWWVLLLRYNCTNILLKLETEIKAY